MAIAENITEDKTLKDQVMPDGRKRDVRSISYTLQEYDSNISATITSSERSEFTYVPFKDADGKQHGNWVLIHSYKIS
jgi:hypothetical protein